MKLFKAIILFYFICLSLGSFKAIGQNTNVVKALNIQFKDSLPKNLIVARDLAKQACLYSEILKDSSLLLQSYSNLSLVYYRKKQNDSSLLYTKKALDLAGKLNDDQKMAALLNRMGALERKNGNYTTALKLYQNAIDIAKKYAYIEEMCDIYNNSASLYRARGDKKKFSEELENAISISKTNNLQNCLANSYNIKGISLFATNKDSAIFYYKEAIRLFEITGQKHFEGLVYSNLGDIYINIGKYAKALESLERSEQLAIQVNNLASLYFINLSLGIYYIEIGNYKQCLAKYEKAINEYGIYVDKDKFTHGYWLLTEGYYLNKQYKKAYEAQEKYIALNEELINAEKAREFDEIRTIYEVQEKDNHIELLEKENELAKARRQAILIIGLLITVALSLLILYYRYRITSQKTISRKEKEHLKKEQEIIQIKAQIAGQDKERHRIAKELHDGLGGQLAGVNLRLSQLNSELKNPNINSVNDELSVIFRDLRILSHNLSASYFQDKAFNELLMDLKQQYEGLGAFEVSISVFPDDSLNDLGPDVKHNLYRILQELFGNATKHSNCDYIELTINRHEKNLVVIFGDDGVGFNTEDVKAGIGLSNITERAKSINSNLKIDSHQGKGSQIMLQIPV